MRQILSILSILCLGLTAARSQSLNIATWMVELPEVNSTSTNRAAEYEPLLKRAAGVLKPLNADIILLHGLPDRPAAKQLTELLRPRVYHTPVFSSFRRSSQNPERAAPPLTVLSRKQPLAMRTIEWQTSGRIDLPGGFSFAIFPFGSNVLFLYTAQFPKAFAGMKPEDEAAIPRRRERSARYLVSHLNWLQETTTEAGKFAYLACDLALDDTNSTHDPVLAVLTASGFKPCAGHRTLVASAALSATGWPPDGALTSAFIRGTEFPGDPASVGQKGFFAPIALVEVDLKASAPAIHSGANTGLNPRLTAKPGADADVGASVRGAGSWFTWADNRSAIIGAGAALFFAGCLFLITRSQSRPIGRAPIPIGGSVRSDRLGRGDRVERLMGPEEASRAAGREGSTIHVLVGPGGPGDRGVPEERSDIDERATLAKEATPKAAQRPFLQLLRERLVRWLAAERSHLLSSHHAGAEQVLDLEERLTKIQNQFEHRLRAREQRIVELEAELMAHGRAAAERDHGPGPQLPRKVPTTSSPPSSPS